MAVYIATNSPCRLCDVVEATWGMISPAHVSRHCITNGGKSPAVVVRHRVRDLIRRKKVEQRDDGLLVWIAK